MTILADTSGHQAQESRVIGALCATCMSTASTHCAFMKTVLEGGLCNFILELLIQEPQRAAEGRTLP